MIIGVVGFISSGKGTVGNILETEYAFKKESFAKSLKDATAAMFGWPRQWLEGDSIDPWAREWRERVDQRWAAALGIPDFSPRKALQMLGTEAGRNIFGNKIWTTGCLHRCTQDREVLKANFVITDTRFKNEIDAIKEVNGIVVRVKRGDDPEWFNFLSNIQDDESRMKFMKANHPTVHQSEWDWVGSKFDYTILNDGTQEDLKHKVHQMLSHVKFMHGPYVKSTVVYKED
jgi:hypothetical protein